MPIQRWSETIWVVKLNDDPAFADDMDDLTPALADHPDVNALVLDLSGVDHINSSNLSQLLTLRKTASQSDIRLKLVSPPNHVWAVFLAAGLDKVFSFAPDPMTALAELQMDAGSKD